MEMETWEDSLEILEGVHWTNFLVNGSQTSVDVGEVMPFKKRVLVLPHIPMKELRITCFTHHSVHNWQNMNQTAPTQHCKLINERKKTG
jgi:hypothetical protein